MIGRFGGKKNLRHTDGVGRGNVRVMKITRDFHFTDDENWVGVSNRR